MKRFRRSSSGEYLIHAKRPDSFRAPYCDCTETCPECFREARDPIGRISSEERAERLARMELRVGHIQEEDA